MDHRIEEGKNDVVINTDEALRIGLLGEGDKQRPEVVDFSRIVFNKKYGLQFEGYPLEFLTLASEEAGLVASVGVDDPLRGATNFDSSIKMLVEEGLYGNPASEVKVTNTVHIYLPAVERNSLCAPIMAALAGFLTGRKKRFVFLVPSPGLCTILSGLGFPYTEILIPRSGKISIDATIGGARKAPVPSSVILIDIESSLKSLCFTLLKEEPGKVNSKGRGNSKTSLERLFYKGQTLGIDSSEVLVA